MKPEYSDVVKTILARPRNGAGDGIPLTRGEAAMLFFDGYAGDGPELLDVRALGYAHDELWHGLTHSDVFSTDHDSDAAFIWSKWPPLELWCSPNAKESKYNTSTTNHMLPSDGVDFCAKLMSCIADIFSLELVIPISIANDDSCHLFIQRLWRL